MLALGRVVRLELAPQLVHLLLCKQHSSIHLLIIRCQMLYRSGALQQTFNGNPPACPVSCCLHIFPDMLRLLRLRPEPSTYPIKTTEALCRGTSNKLLSQPYTIPNIWVTYKLSNNSQMALKRQ